MKRMFSILAAIIFCGMLAVGCISEKSSSNDTPVVPALSPGMTPTVFVTTSD